MQMSFRESPVFPLEPPFSPMGERLITGPGVGVSAPPRLLLYHLMRVEGLIVSTYRWSPLALWYGVIVFNTFPQLLDIVPFFYFSILLFQFPFG